VKAYRDTWELRSAFVSDIFARSIAARTRVAYTKRQYVRAD
jgi:hypothetical protein